MPSTENFRKYQETMKSLFTILQDAVTPIVDKHVEDWKYDNTGFDGRCLNGADHDDMVEEVSVKLDELAEEIDREVLNGVLKVIASFRLHRTFNYPGVGSDILAIRQKQLNKRGIA